MTSKSQHIILDALKARKSENLKLAAEARGHFSPSEMAQPYKLGRVSRQEYFDQRLAEDEAIAVAIEEISVAQ